jgi:hypothetical protein
MGTSTPMGTPLTSRQIPDPKSQNPRRWDLVIGIWVLITLAATSVGAAERYVVIVSGASGGEKYAEQQKKWRSELTVFLTSNFSVPDANVVALDEESSGTAQATAQNVRALLGDLRRRVTRDDTLLLVLLGHGTFDGADAKFNLVGPDMSAPEWKSAVDGIVGRLVIINTTEASYPFLEELSKTGRVIITATDSAQQRFATVFPEYFIRSLADLSSDLDKNGRISLWEAFTSASAGVKKHYEQRGQLSTERPLLDDNGDRVGREADAPGEDGTMARAIYLDADRAVMVSGNPAIAELERARQLLERRLEELKARKPLMSDEQYQKELEAVLIELARVAQEIRRSS